MAIVLAKGTFCGGANVTEDEARRCLGCDPLKILAIPCRNGGREDAWGGSELGVGIEADAKAIGIVLTSSSVLRREVSGQLRLGSDDWTGRKDVQAVVANQRTV